MFDQRCAELAEHFLQRVPNATADDRFELARAIQDLCENFCRTIEQFDRNK